MSDLRSLTEVDRLLHEPSRAVIVAILATVESADFVFLQRETNLTKGNLSAHLTKLQEAGYIQIEKTFRGKYPLTLCRLTDTGRQAFQAYRQKLRQFVEQTK
ncbi:MAG: ArsR family transcriptional regulator [Anaerolineae bacterium]|nr:MAG: ArsR family transcriptional regulator [Anaerolineae bacterium]